jgi:hypothetical protein
MFRNFNEAFDEFNRKFDEEFNQRFQQFNGQRNVALTEPTPTFSPEFNRSAAAFDAEFKQRIASFNAEMAASEQKAKQIDEQIKRELEENAAKSRSKTNMYFS